MKLCLISVKKSKICASILIGYKQLYNNINLRLNLSVDKIILQIG